MVDKSMVKGERIFGCRFVVDIKAGPAILVSGKHSKILGDENSGQRASIF